MRSSGTARAGWDSNGGYSARHSWWVASAAAIRSMARRTLAPGAPVASAVGLVDRVLVLAQVVLGEDHGAGGDLRLGRVAVQRGHGLLDALGADVGRLLRDERLDEAVLQVLDLLGAGVEADDLHRVLLARFAQAGGRALGAEQVGGEDALQVRVLGQRGLDDRGRLVRLVVVVLDAHEVQPELLGLLLEAL